MADAAFNNRPLSLQPTPLSIYEPAFGRFVKKLNKSIPQIRDFTQAELTLALEFIEISSQLFKEESDRQAALSRLRFPVTGQSWNTKDIPSGGSTYHPDGGFFFDLVKFDGNVYLVIKELKNGKGEGKCDGASQSQRYYMKLIASEIVSISRTSSCACHSHFTTINLVSRTSPCFVLPSVSCGPDRHRSRYLGSGDRGEVLLRAARMRYAGSKI